MSGAEPVGLVLLRGLVADLGVRVGDVMTGRVLSREAVVLAGVRVRATVPEGLAAGDVVRLRVTEAGAARTVLEVVGSSGSAAVAAVPESLAGAFVASSPVRLPSGAVARLLVEEGEGEGGPGSGALGPRVVLRYESDALGRVDVGLSLAPSVVLALVHAPAGAVAAGLTGAADALRDALEAATSRVADVQVVGREEAFDARA